MDDIRSIHAGSIRDAYGNLARAMAGIADRVLDSGDADLAHHLYIEAKLALDKSLAWISDDYPRTRNAMRVERVRLTCRAMLAMSSVQGRPIDQRHIDELADQLAELRKAGLDAAQADELEQQIALLRVGNTRTYSS